MEIVDIIMGTYNGERYIKEQIDSIIKNTWKNWRVWVCDDGSTDKTEEIVKRYEEEYPDKIFWKPNEKNKGAAINFLDGARKATGDYVMFCDQDDYWLPNKIEDTLNCMKEAEAQYGDKTPITVFTDAIVVDEQLQTIKDSFHKSSKLDTSKLDLSHMLMENKMMGCTMLLNRALLEELRKFPKKVRMHDWWAGIVAAAYGRIIYLDKPTMLYRQHTNNVVGSTEFSKDVVLEKASTWKRQKQVLLETQMQASSLYKLAENELPGDISRVIYAFATLHEKNWVNRRIQIVRYKFWKSGVIRNIGVLLLI